MNVSLTPELESYVQAKVETGRYTSASEVIREVCACLSRKRSATKRSRSFRPSWNRPWHRSIAAKELTGKSFSRT